MKRLVCFFDGTWDTPHQTEVTNVVKLQRAMLQSDAAGVHQCPHYEIGIATEFTGRLLGRLSFLAGALSIGLSRRVRGAYHYLCENFQPGDEIYLFGFSRGAFEARTLAELIAVVGLPPAQALERARQGWRYYRRFGDQPEAELLHRLREGMHYPVRIRCIGVWDTVGDLALPFLRTDLSRISALPENVDVALQALAIDEPRGAFRPVLWTHKRDAASPAAQIIEQVWFPGSHVDVGGGGEARGLADAALRWMAERVTATTGLAVDSAYLQAITKPDAEGEQCLPTTGIYRFSQWLPFVRLIDQDPRAVHPLRRLLLRSWRTNRLPHAEQPTCERVHASARTRLGKIVPMRRGLKVRARRYYPRNLRFAIPPAAGDRRTAGAAANTSDAVPERLAGKSALAGWVLFEWAAQPFYTLIVTFLFGPYFVNQFVADPVRGQSLWAYGAAAAGVLIAVGSPILGAVVDVKGGAKWRMGLLVVCFAAAMAGLWIARPGSGAPIIALVLAAYVIATASAEFAIVLLNGMMPTLVPREQYGRLSGISWGLGYLGGLLALIFVAALVVVNGETGKTLLGMKPLLTLDAATGESDRIVGPLCALWLLVFSTPFFLLTPDLGRRRHGARIADGLRAFVATLVALPRHGNILLFLAARMVFIDGLTAIFQFGGIYAASIFGWHALEQSQFAIVLVLAGVIGAVCGGFLDDRIGAKRVIIGSLLVLIFGAIGLLSVDHTHVLFHVAVPPKAPDSAVFSSAGERVFLAFAVALALVAAPAQASCRSLLARLAPPDQVSQFFGLFAFSGKATAFLAPTLIGLATALAHSQRIGLATVLVFLGIGLAGMTLVREAR
jgi:UMF1 family MFS transporter